MLTISKASAGAGKTHNLTKYYLMLLLKEYYSGKESPYRHILAVTFTNKATAEMKDRIISELDTLSSGRQSNYLQDLLPLVCDRSGNDNASEAVLRRDAGVMLRAILNDYTGFNVSTIDSFFQVILRAFAREMGQSSSYNVELNTADIMVESVDSLLASLDDSGKGDLLKWLTEMAVDEIEKGNGWDISKKLNGLGKFVFSEEYRMQALEGSVMDRAEMSAFRDTLRKLRSSFEGEVASLAGDALDRMASAGLLPTDFIQGSKSPMLKLEGLSKGVMAISSSFSKAACSIGPEGWYSKTSANKAAITLLFSSPFRERLQDIDSLFKSDRYSDYITAGLVLKNFSMLGIVNDLRLEVEKWCRDNNSVILSETNDFLHRIIDQEETPFVYEKAATRIDHYMLDEFQDTSSMQWDNFRPLVKDSVDSGQENLIVGDVKQSIYRWRNSDWKLLSDQVVMDFRPSELKMDPLSENWRSGRAIVDFNNDFFSWASMEAQGKYNAECSLSSTVISSIYSDVEQKVPDKRKSIPGHVMVNFVENPEEGSWKDSVLEMLPGRIEEMHSHGVSYGDMAILVRANEDGAKISDFLIGKGYDIVTEESLLISSSGSVRKLISVLKYLLHPDDGMSRWLYEHSGISVTGTLDMPLYDLCEWTISCLSENERKQVAYLQAFMDYVKDYVAKIGSDLGGFIRWWDERGSSISISAPDGSNSIRVMTIHKSKGLGMKAVIIPFFTCELTRSNGVTIWCRSDRKPFCDAGVVPVSMCKGMLDSAFRQNYLDEMLFQYIDSLNMAYVAFTRAADELHIFTMSGGKRNSVSELLSDFLSVHGLLVDGTYESGEWYLPRKEGENCSSEDNRFNVSPSFETVSGSGRIHVSLRNVEKMSESASSRLRGIVMHDIFSRIKTREDVASAVDDAVLKGDILESERTGVLADVNDRIKMAESAGFRWFDGSYKVICEMSVLSPGGKERRPDRVMISGSEAVVVDYKFGAEHSQSYDRQVSDYMTSLKEMGYQDVKGYLWYNDRIDRIVG